MRAAPTPECPYVSAGSPYPDLLSQLGRVRLASPHRDFSMTAEAPVDKRVPADRGKASVPNEPNDEVLRHMADPQNRYERRSFCKKLSFTEIIRTPSKSNPPRGSNPRPCPFTIWDGSP
jgi:hypothetical protein